MDGLELANALMSALPWLGVLVVAAPVGLGAIRGGARLRSLHARIRMREKALDRPVSTAPWIDRDRRVASATLAVGNVVISVDGFRLILAGLQRLAGGEVVGYTTVLDLARREALLRMCEAAPRADAFVGCRITTCSLEDAAHYVEVVVSSTAIQYEARL